MCDDVDVYRNPPTFIAPSLLQGAASAGQDTRMQEPTVILFSVLQYNRGVLGIVEIVSTER